MTLKSLTLAGSYAVTAGAALAATDPPPADEIAAALERLLDLLEHGGPAVVALEVVAGIAFLAALAAVVLVIITAMQALPRVARPVADAWATIRGGATQREEALRRENASLRSEVETLTGKVTTLTGKVTTLEHADEEHRRIVEALLKQLEAAHIDVAAVRAIYDRAEPDAVAA